MPKYEDKQNISFLTIPEMKTMASYALQRQLGWRTQSRPGQYTSGSKL